MNRRHSSLVVWSALALLISTGCDKKDRSAAQVAEPVGANPAAATTGATFRFSQQDSKIGFVGAKVTGKHEGSFGTFSGSLQMPTAEPTKGQVTVTIDMNTISADNAKLTGHLKSPDFFDAAKFPQARFSSTSIRAGSDKPGATHTITGNLELHGVTKSITFPAAIRATPDQVEVDSEFSINRKDFGVVYPGMPDDLIKDDVLIRLSVRAKKGAA
jgi:polyisoprenoid-binding protein YceI